MTTRKKVVVEKLPAGRPSKFKPEYIEQGYQLALLGMTDKDLARIWDVTEQTINTWKVSKDGFLESLQKGKDAADAFVADRLFKRATGYTHKAVKIFNDGGTPMIVDYIEHYPPDTGAAIFWLKNRQKDFWRDKQEVDTTLNANVSANVTTASQDSINALEEKIAKAKESGVN
jgi:DNA-binding XRE family transcriptional regulator